MVTLTIGSGDTLTDKEKHLHALSSEREHETPAALNPSGSQPYIQVCQLQVIFCRLFLPELEIEGAVSLAYHRLL